MGAVFALLEECVHMLMRKFNLKNFSDLRFWLFTPTDDLELAPGTMDSSINVLDLTIKHVSLIFFNSSFVDLIKFF